MEEGEISGVFDAGDGDHDDLPGHLMVEAALFSAGKPVSLEEISDSTGLDPAMVKLYLKKLISSYSRRDTSLEVIKAGRKYSLRIRERYVERISALAAPEVNPKLLKTAALIAYHQPMKQSELVEMYGSKIYDHVKELVSLGLVRTRREGSTKVLTTTHRFSEVFGISSVSKKKVKGHVKDRVLDRLSRTTLDGYEQVQDETENEESGNHDPEQKD
jgi:segregation and condensation protein B